MATVLVGLTYSRVYKMSSLMDDAKFYLVRLCIRIGGYEKYTYHPLRAKNEDDAVLQAMQDESHSEFAGWVDDDRYHWEDCDMMYKADSCKEVNEADMRAFRSAMYGF
jgi:hypothetical protein